MKGTRDTEKIAVGAIRTAIQTWLAPELRSISDRLTHVEARLDGFDQRFNGLETRIERLETRIERVETCIEDNSQSLRVELSAHFESLRSELEVRFGAVRADLRCLDTLADFRERLATLEAKFAQG